MTRIYQTAKGKMIDIDRLKLANENAIAVGNMKVNARGDKIGPGGKVVTGRNAVMDQLYAVPDSVPYSPSDAGVEAMTPQQLNDLANNLNQVTEEDKKTGTVAENLADPKTVKQEPIPDPRRPVVNGPKRI
jgi:ribosomal protein L27